jgi:hypothetical protein
MLGTDTVKKQLQATSAYRAQPCFEWSKQTSRDTAPFFVLQSTPNIRQSNNAVAPPRHTPQIVFDRILGRDAGVPPAQEDQRSYDPKDYHEWHPHSMVNIAKNCPRGNIFRSSVSPDISKIDPFAYPGWVHGRSDWNKSKRLTFAEEQMIFSLHNSAASLTSATSDHSDYFRHVPPWRAEVIEESRVESKAQRVIGGVIPKTEEKKNPERPLSVLSINEQSVARHQSVLDMRRVSAREPPPKPSQLYRSLLAPPAARPDAPQKRTITRGFAPSRYNHRLTLQDLLAQTAADAKRAKSSMDSYFGERARSPLRQTMLYTPSPMNSDR